MKRLQCQAVVLARRPLGEADLVVSLLAEEHGRLEAVAPNGRRSRRRFGGCLEPFGRIEAVLSEGRRAGPWRLEEARSLAPRAGIRADLVAIGQAAYLAELAAALTREGEPAGGFLPRLERGLDALERAPLPAVELRRYELDLLGLSGLAPQLAACVRCGARTSSGWVQDVDLDGGLVCARCSGGGQAALGPQAVALLRALQAGLPPPVVPPEAAREAREALARILDRLIGRTLRSRDFLRMLAEERSTPG